MLPKILSQDSNYDEWCEQLILNATKKQQNVMSLYLVIMTTTKNG